MQANPEIQDTEIFSDEFDRIPDAIVLIILNKLADIRSLGRCSAVSKRFKSLVPFVHNVSVKIDEVVIINGNNDENPFTTSHKPRNFFSNIFRFMFSTLLKPFHHLRGSNNTNKALLPQVSQRTLDEVLKNFHHIHNLWIELPAAGVGTEDGVLLKWKAEFGSTLQNCVILGGTQIEKKPVTDQGLNEDNGSIPDSFYTNGILKLRVMWAISSLIAASTRHYLLEPIIKDHPTLKTVVCTDVDGQGTLSMGSEQLREFREKAVATSTSSRRTQVPASSMKVRYAPYLELPEGMGMQGATLVAIKPSSEGNGTSKMEVEAFVCGAFDEPFKAAVRSLVKRKTYLLEMNGF